MAVSLRNERDAAYLCVRNVGASAVFRAEAEVIEGGECLTTPLPGRYRLSWRSNGAAETEIATDQSDEAVLALFETLDNTRLPALSVSSFRLACHDDTTGGVGYVKSSDWIPEADLVRPSVRLRVTVSPVGEGNAETFTHDYKVGLFEVKAVSETP